MMLFIRMAILVYISIFSLTGCTYMFRDHNQNDKHIIKDTSGKQSVIPAGDNLEP
jgi:hypothetical protein